LKLQSEKKRSEPISKSIDFSILINNQA